MDFVEIIDLLLKQEIGVLVAGDPLMSKEGNQAILKESEAAFHFAFGLSIWGDTVSDAKGCQGALKLRGGVEAIRSGLVAKKAQTIGIKGRRKAIATEDLPKKAKVIPGGIGWDKNASNDLSGMVIDGQDEALKLIAPPAMRRGIMLEEFADGGALPTTPWLGAARHRRKRLWEMSPNGPGNGGARADKIKAPGQFVGKECEIYGTTMRQKPSEEIDNVIRPRIDTAST